MGTSMVDAARNLTAASDMVHRLFEENRRLKAELNRMRALHEAATADIEIERGRAFRLIEPEE